MKPVILWVHPDFKKKMKIESANNGCSMIELTKKLSENKDGDEVNIKSGRRFNFRF